jgi:predicted nucleic acid-binding protein
VILVIDASAAYDLLTEGRCAQHILGAEELISPDLIVAELLNARWKVARSREAVPQLDTVLEFLDRLRIIPSLPYAADAARLAERLNHPVYGCLYVAAAQHERAKLLTLDSRLSRKLRSSALARILQ